MQNQSNSTETFIIRLTDNTQSPEKTNVTVTLIIAQNSCKHLVLRACAQIYAMLETVYKLLTDSI
jgi:hypothetical protein